MEHSDNEHQLNANARQQAIEAWSMDFIDNVEYEEQSSPVPPPLTVMGLGRAAAYLETHTEYLTAAFNHRDWSVRTAAVQVLGKQGERIPIELVLNALQDEHPSVRAIAARVLGRQGKRTPTEPLFVALHDPEWRVRAAAALALGRLANRASVEPLVSILHDEHAEVRAAAVWALGRLGERAPIEQLVIALQDKVWSVREAAAMTLKEQGERAPLAPLLAARWDEDSSVREAIESTLDHRLAEQPGQKLIPKNQGRSSPSWLRLAVAVISVLMLIPLTGALFSNEYIDQFVVVSKIIALGVVCLAIWVINIICQRKRFRMLPGSQRDRSSFSGSAVSWQGVVLAVISLGVLIGITSGLLDTAFTNNSGIKADIVQFILISRLMALGLVSLTVIVVNILFHLKQN